LQGRNLAPNNLQGTVPSKEIGFRDEAKEKRSDFCQQAKIA